MSWYLPPATRYPSIRSLPTGSEVDALEKATIHGEVHPVDVGGPVNEEKGHRGGHVTGRAECAGWVAALGRLEEGRHGLLDPAPVATLLEDGAGRDDVAADAAGAEDLSLAQRPVRHRRLERAVAVAAGGEVLRHRGCPDGDDVAVGAGGQ